MYEKFLAEEKGVMDGFCMDLEKAFDKVPREIVIEWTLRVVGVD